MQTLLIDIMDQEQFCSELHRNLTDNILSYWSEKMTDPGGGFYGRRDGLDRLHAEAPKGAILNARILWSFSAAYRYTNDEEYAALALRARDYMVEHFIDKEFGGVYWSVDAEGNPLETKKQFYAIAFTIYGLSEHYRATGDVVSLNLAKELFHMIETHSRDRERGGYVEAANRDWSPIGDMRLSDKDENASKTMNTHLHILEAYTSLLRVWDNQELRDAQRELIGVFLDKILDRESNHLGLFFDDDWHREDGEISYGHDIEASWLLYEAAEVLGNPEIFPQVKEATRRIAIAALHGRCHDGSMVYERCADGTYDNDKHWWVQAESIVGMLYLWKHHDMPEMMDKAMETWNYIKENLVDNENGEWYWSRKADGDINRVDDKAGFWKCPYHNSRMHLEALSLLDFIPKH